MTGSETPRAAWPQRCRAPQLTARVVGLSSTPWGPALPPCLWSGVAGARPSVSLSVRASLAGTGQEGEIPNGSGQREPGMHRPCQPCRRQEGSSHHGTGVPHGSRCRPGAAPAPERAGVPQPPHLRSAPGPGPSAEPGMGSSGCQGGAARGRARTAAGRAGHGPATPAMPRGPDRALPVPRGGAGAAPCPCPSLSLPAGSPGPAAPAIPRYWRVPQRSPPCGAAGPRCAGTWTP